MAERRYSQTELRAAEDKITGYASVFFDGSRDTEYQLWDGAVERIHPDAFARALKEQHDVRALVNHDSNWLLGRTTSGTLRLSVDKKGLRYDIQYDPQDDQHRITRAKIARGDLSGSSFAFRVTAEEWRQDGDREVRTIKDVQLIDVGPVVFPAYEGSTTGLRSAGHAEEARSSYENWKARQETEKRIAHLHSLKTY